MGETGATEQQIEAAAERMHVDRTRPGRVAHYPDWPCPVCMGQADSWSAVLVPQDHRIVPASALPDAATVAAVERCATWLEQWADDDELSSWAKTAATLRAFLAAQEGTGDDTV